MRPFLLSAFVLLISADAQASGGRPAASQRRSVTGRILTGSIRVGGSRIGIFPQVKADRVKVFGIVPRVLGKKSHALGLFAVARSSAGTKHGELSFATGLLSAYAHGTARSGFLAVSRDRTAKSLTLAFGRTDGKAGVFGYGYYGGGYGGLVGMGGENGAGLVYGFGANNIGAGIVNYGYRHSLGLIPLKPMFDLLAR